MFPWRSALVCTFKRVNRPANPFQKKQICWVQDFGGGEKTTWWVFYILWIVSSKYGGAKPWVSALCRKLHSSPQHWNANLRWDQEEKKQKKKRQRQFANPGVPSGTLKCRCKVTRAASFFGEAAKRLPCCDWPVHKVAFNISVQTLGCIPVRAHFPLSSVPMQMQLQRSEFRENPASSRSFA